MSQHTQRDIDAVGRVIAVLRGMPPEAQLRVLRTVAAFCGFDPDKLPALSAEYLEVPS